MDKMNPVAFWSELIKSYNRQKKCGFCWNFYAPLTEVKLNQVQLKKLCCVNVFLVWDKGVDFDTFIETDYDIDELEKEIRSDLISGNYKFEKQ